VNGASSRGGRAAPGNAPADLVAEAETPPLEESRAGTEVRERLQASAPGHPRRDALEGYLRQQVAGCSGSRRTNAIASCHSWSPASIRSWASSCAIASRSISASRSEPRSCSRVHDRAARHAACGEARPVARRRARGRRRRRRAAGVVGRRHGGAAVGRRSRGLDRRAARGRHRRHRSRPPTGSITPGAKFVYGTPKSAKSGAANS